MTRVLLIDIPAPCEWINSNSRKHRMAVANLTRQWRTAARIAAGVGKHAPFDGRVRVIAHIWKKRRGRYDPGNLYGTAKACVDGALVDTKILPDDSVEFLVGPDMRHAGWGEPRIILEITETDE